ncbi:MMPL family transporter [Streptomyces sp. NPDC051286]|uniref:MMPL family transporter n=1 Tax=Streptomyces sp. NPDC051286 TaxID=3365647 RepID=UPI00378C65AF
MATFLSRLGRFSFRRRWPVTLLWVVLLVGTGVLAGRAPAAPPSEFSMPGTEAQHAYDLLEESFPELNADGATARVVFRAEDGRITDPEVRKAVQETVRELGYDPQVARITDPYATRSVSQDGSTAYAQVAYEVPAPELTQSARDALQDTVARTASQKLSVEVGGNAVNAVGGGHSSEAMGLAVAALVLVLTFGSLLAAGLPLLTAMLGVGLGVRPGPTPAPTGRRPPPAAPCPSPPQLTPRTGACPCPPLHPVRPGTTPSKEPSPPPPRSRRWPVCTLQAGYGEVVRFADRLTDGLSPAEKSRVFHANAADVYGLRPPARP